MKSTDLIKPTPIQTPIALNGNKNIPSQTAEGSNTSSISEGYLPITSQPLSEGGQAPERVDFNGMFYLSTDLKVYLQNGGYITYEPTVATKIGGYPKGAVLNYLNSSGKFSQVKSLIDNNQYNFVSTPSYINNVYWQDITNTGSSSSGTSVIETLKRVYPVGSIFLGTTSTCPIASLFGTWTLVAADRVLQGSSSNHSAGSTIPASLPNIEGRFSGVGQSFGHTPNTTGGAFYIYNSVNQPTEGATVSNDGQRDDVFGFSAYRSNTLYSGTTLQPSAYVVNVWRRTA